MASKNKLVAQVKTHLGSGENIVFSVRGYDLNNKQILLSSTNKGIVLYYSRLTGYDIESFQYDKVTSLATGESFMGGNLSFFVPGKKISIKWIKDADFYNVVTNIKQGLGLLPAPLQTVVPPIASIKTASNNTIVKRQKPDRKALLIIATIIIFFVIRAVFSSDDDNFHPYNTHAVNPVPVTPTQVQATSSEHWNLQDSSSTPKVVSPEKTPLPKVDQVVKITDDQERIVAIDKVKATVDVDYWDRLGPAVSYKEAYQNPKGDGLIVWIGDIAYPSAGYVYLVTSTKVYTVSGDAATLSPNLRPSSSLSFSDMKDIGIYRANDFETLYKICMQDIDFYRQSGLVESRIAEKEAACKTKYGSY